MDDDGPRLARERGDLHRQQGGGCEAGIEVHLVMDNYATHKADKVRNWFNRHPRYHPKPFIWTAGADLILGKVPRLCERISNSGH